MARRALRKLGELRPAVRSRHGAALAGAAFVPRHRPVACLWAAARREPGGRAMIWVWILLAAALTWGGIRSEEHTSELQSLMRISYAGFCLKKKKERSMKLL